MQEITLRYPKELRRLWSQGKLHGAWFYEYEGLFDQHDQDNADGQFDMQHKGFNFGEWFTAIHFFKHGYRVLTPKYALPSRRKKWPILARLLGKKGLTLLTSYEVKHPDLFVYDPAHKVYFFVEVKLETDRLSDDQATSFRKIEGRLGCQVLIVKLRSH